MAHTPTAAEAQADVRATNAMKAQKHRTADSYITASMPSMVKGLGYVTGIADGRGGEKLAPLKDSHTIVSKSMEAEEALWSATRDGVANPGAVFKGLSPEFSNRLGPAMLVSNPASTSLNSLIGEIQGAFAELGKNITLTSPNATGFVPFDLVNPSRLIFPVYSPLRNKIPRTPGQGTSRQEKVITAISGSGQTSAPVIDMTIPELVGGGNLSNWPLNLPGSGTQVSVNLNVPYRFWGLTESLSWLAQFAGQGFEDISALANLVLLQEFMLNEEYADIAATSIATAAPTLVSVALRAKGAGEVGLTGAGANVYVAVTGTNYYGETVMSTVTVASGSFSTGTQVADITITGVPGGLQSFNIYAATAASAPARAGMFLAASNVGGSRFTLQGAVPTTGTVPPAADNGSSGSNRQEGLLSVLSGHSANGSIYPAGWQAGYNNNAVGDTLNSTVLNAALAGLWDNPGAFRADPSEIIAEGGDVMRLSNDILNKGNAGAYRLFVQQSEVDGIRDGAAVSEFQNPITRSALKIMVHPWLTQGTAMLMSYTLPFAWSNVANVVEKVVVQDYLSISWPVIDASFRYSMFMYGALVVNAPQYCGLLQGLQVQTGNGTSVPYL